MKSYKYSCLLLAVVGLPSLCRASTRPRWFRRSPPVEPIDTSDDEPSAENEEPRSRSFGWLKRGNEAEDEPADDAPQEPEDENDNEENEKYQRYGDRKDEDSVDNDSSSTGDNLAGAESESRPKRGFFSRWKRDAVDVEKPQPEEGSDFAEEEDDEEEEQEDADDEEDEEGEEDDVENDQDTANGKSSSTEPEADSEKEVGRKDEDDRPQQSSSYQRRQRFYGQRHPSSDGRFHNDGSSQPQRVIVLGSGPPDHQDQRTTIRPDTSAITDVITSMMASGMSVAYRWWFISWITRRMSHFEDAVIPTQQFVWERLNDRFDRDASALQTVLSRAPSKLRPMRWRHAVRRFQGRKPHQRRILANIFRRTVVVVHLVPGSRESAEIDLESLPEIVSFLIRQQDKHAFGTDKTTGEPLELEVVFCIDSGGGSATAFGKAASQVARLRQHPYITTTVCVDEIAASGGYMIASQVDRILAAPFAVVGKTRLFTAR